MALNFSAVCHIHREHMVISRGDEHAGLHSFYREHQDCAADDPHARLQVEVASDNGPTERWWMDDPDYRHYYFTHDYEHARVVGGMAPYGMGYRKRVAR